MMQLQYAGVRCCGKEFSILSLFSAVLIFCGVASIGAIGAIIISPSDAVSSPAPAMAEQHTFHIQPPRGFDMEEDAPLMHKKVVSFSAKLNEIEPLPNLERKVYEKKEQWVMAAPPKNVFRLATLKVRNK